MKRIYLSILVILGTVALTVGAAYAYFTSNAVSLTGITLASATPSLQIWDGDSWEAAAPGVSETNMYPGWVGPERDFYVKNTTPGTGNVPFDKLIPTLVTAGGADWDALKGVVKARFYDVVDGVYSGWYTLEEWRNNSSLSVLGSTDINSNEQRNLRIQYAMDSGAGDDAKGRIVGIQWNFVARTP